MPPEEHARLKAPAPRSALDDALRFLGHTQDKLELLTYYLTIYRKIAGGGTYIDGFAGCGLVEIDGQIRPGSALLAAHSGAFGSFHLYEKSSQNMRSLQKCLLGTLTERQVARTGFKWGDVNELLVRDLRHERIDRSRPCFAFLDPYSTELDWQTVEQLASYKTQAGKKFCKVELFILLNTQQALIRLANDHRTEAPGRMEALCRVYGQEGVRNLRLGDESTSSLAHRYCLQLERLGYGAAAAYQVRDPRSHRLAYHMIHASDHPAAHSIMPWARRRLNADYNDVPLPLRGL